mgnify:FL=1
MDTVNALAMSRFILCTNQFLTETLPIICMETFQKNIKIHSLRFSKVIDQCHILLVAYIADIHMVTTEILQLKKIANDYFLSKFDESCDVRIVNYPRLCMIFEWTVND